jgi:Putative auto-transporter adhesin, head GIN domain
MVSVTQKNMLMQRILFSTLLFLAVAANAQVTIKDANAQVRKVGNFTGVRASAGVEVLIKQGNEDAVAVSASDASYTDKIITEVSNGVLKISFDNDWFKSRPRNLKLRAYVSIRKVNTLDGSSGSMIKTDGALASDDLSMDFGSGSIFEGTLNAKSLTIDQGSGSIINLQGSVANLKVSTGSGSIFHGYQAQSENCIASASSGAMVQVTVNKSITAKASSGGSIGYKGNATMQNVSTSSGGSVSRKS